MIMMKDQPKISRFFKPVKRGDLVVSGDGIHTVKSSRVELNDGVDSQSYDDRGVIGESGSNYTEVESKKQQQQQKSCPVEPMSINLAQFKRVNHTQGSNLVKGAVSTANNNNSAFAQRLDRVMHEREAMATRNHSLTQDGDFGTIEEQEDSSSDLYLNNKKVKRRKLDGDRCLYSETDMTPLDRQVRDLKLENMDKLLVVRVGYKYKCFAQDAVIASQILHIKLIPGKLTIDGSNPNDSQYKQYAYCSFPDTRLRIHLERLIHSNLKVGIVEQAETSAVKRVIGSRKDLFQREVTNTFTKASYGVNMVDYTISDNDNDGNKDTILGESNSIWVLRIIVRKPRGKLLYYLLSANLNNGEVVYDIFEDLIGSIEQLNTRVSHLQPSELVIFCDETAVPKRVFSMFQDMYCKIHGDGKFDLALQEPNADIVDSCCDPGCRKVLKQLKDGIETESDFPSSLLPLVIELYEYLKDYHNENVLSKTSNFKPFVSKVRMMLTGNVLESLDIFANDSKRGSLFWLLDHTRTAFGSRLLKEWVMRPLIQRNDIEDRLNAVECIKDVVSNIFFESLNRMLKSTPDLLRTLNRLSYGNTSRREVYYFLKQLVSFSNHFRLHSRFIQEQILDDSGCVSTKSLYLAKLLREIDTYFRKGTLERLLSMVNVSGVLEQNSERQLIYFLNLSNYDNSDGIISLHKEMENIRNELTDELHKIRKVLRRPQLRYKDEISYLIEVRNQSVRNLPDDWTKVSSTKTVSRFTTPTTLKLVNRLQYFKELLIVECTKEFKRFVNMINDEYSSLRRVIDNFAEYDCILSLAAVSCNLNYVRPKFVDNEESNGRGQMIKATKSRNPVIESLDKFYVANDVNLSQQDGKINIITGPNMGGKSSYIRQVALLVIMAQIGSFVPASSLELTLFDSVLTRIGAHDNILCGDSTFKVEMLEVLNMLQQSTSKSLLLFDEVGRGTSTTDGRAIAYALLKYLTELNDNCPLVMFTTHFTELQRVINSDMVRSYYMNYVEKRNPNESWTSVVFLYALEPGVSSDSYGLNVAKLARIDDDILNEAYQVSKTVKSEESLSENILGVPLKIRELLKCFRFDKGLCGASGEEDSLDRESCRDIFQELLQLEENVTDKDST